MAKRFKKPRVGIALDMTPMVDIGFLLLTFFMLTTQFRPPELPEAAVEIPASHSAIKVPESDVMTITINQDGGIFLSVDPQKLQEALLVDRVKKDWDYLPADVKRQYGDAITMARLVPAYPVKITDLRVMLPQARIKNPKLRTVVKGDRRAEYGPASKVMDELLKANIVRFNLLTDFERN